MTGLAAARRLRRARRQPPDGALRGAALLRLAAGQDHRPRRATGPRRSRGCGGRWRETVVEGVKTTIPFHLKVLADPAFVAGRLHQRRRRPPAPRPDGPLALRHPRPRRRRAGATSSSCWPPPSPAAAAWSSSARRSGRRAGCCRWPSGCARAARAAGVTFIVNDRVDLALAVGRRRRAPGPGRPARRASPGRCCGPGMILGVSTHSVAQARAAQADGADYVAVGSMFPTRTKADFELVGPDLAAETPRRDPCSPGRDRRDHARQRAARSSGPAPTASRSSRRCAPPTTRERPASAFSR